MARREVLVQLDDLLVNRLDELAKRIGVSRSELLRRAAVAMLQADEMARSDKWLVEAYGKYPPEAALLEAAHHLAAQTAPNW